MRSSDKKTHRKIWIVAIVILVAAGATFGAGVLYLSDYYHADTAAINAFLPIEDTWEITDGKIVFSSPEATEGLIFYPGGKVECSAYVPLMQACAERGITCVLLEMPFNLAVFDMAAAEGIQEEYPHIGKWYIGGHSLGGSMAASYLADHADSYEGLILLGSYSTANLSETDLEVLSVYGSEDRVMNRKKYEKNKKNLPTNFSEVIIDGGCHAYFGMYGAQSGDGVPTISNEMQINVTADAITAMINGEDR